MGRVLCQKHRVAIMAANIGAGVLQVKEENDLPHGAYYTLISPAGKHRTLTLALSIDPKSPITYDQAMQLMGQWVKKNKQLPGEKITVRKLEFKGGPVNMSDAVRPGDHQMHYTASACDLLRGS